MQVYVNDLRVTLFEGARVRDAVNKYASRLFINTGQTWTVVKDDQGNQVMPDGSLSENDRIYVEFSSGV